MAHNPFKAQVALLGNSCTSIDQIMDREEEVIILCGQAKRIFAVYVCVGLEHGAAFDFWTEPEVIIGRQCGHFEQGDPNYMGLAGHRVWHRWPERN